MKAIVGWLCERCKDGKTTGEKITVYGVCPQVLCDQHRRMLLSSLCDDPGVKESYQRMAGIRPSNAAVSGPAIAGTLDRPCSTKGGTS